MCLAHDREKIQSGVSFRLVREGKYATELTFLRSNRYTSRCDVRRQVQLILRAIVHPRTDFSRDPIETSEDARIGRLMRH